MAKLRLIHDATKTRERALASVDRKPQLSQDEFARRILTANHGPSCAKYLARTFKKEIHKRGYFVARLPANEEPPMWFMIAIRFFSGRTARWSVFEFTRGVSRFWKVSYLRNKLFARAHGSHLRVV